MTSWLQLSWVEHLIMSINRIISKRAFINLQEYLYGCWFTEFRKANSCGIITFPVISCLARNCKKLGENYLISPACLKLKQSVPDKIHGLLNCVCRGNQGFVCMENCLHVRRSVKLIVKVKYRFFFSLSYKVLNQWKRVLYNVETDVMVCHWSSQSEIVCYFRHFTSGRSVCREGFSFANLDATISSHFLAWQR